jgi:hypothetical protein
VLAELKELRRVREAGGSGQRDVALVDLGLPPIRDIPQVPMRAQEVLKAAGVILEHLREAHASGAGPRD